MSAHHPPTLLTLPPELRNSIYIHAFSTHTHIHTCISTPILTTTTPPLNNLSLLLTCRQIHHEAALLAYTLTTFLTTSWRPNPLATRLASARLSEEQAKCINSLTLASHLADNFLTSGDTGAGHHTVVRRFVMFLEGVVGLTTPNPPLRGGGSSKLATTARLPALEEIQVLYDRRSDKRAFNFKGLLLGEDRRIERMLKHVMGLTNSGVEFVQTGQFELGGASKVERVGYVLRWGGAGTGTAKRELRVEFLGFWGPSEEEFRKIRDAKLAVIQDEGPTVWEARRRERPFLTAGESDPARRMTRHEHARRSLGNEQGGRSARSSLGADASWIGRSPRSSLGGRLSARSSMGEGQ